jgi:cytochrome c biogenesis protein CcmG/thiol:disulfide interchange protein DsbE
VHFGVWQAVAVVSRRPLAASIAALAILAGCAGCGSHPRSAAPSAQTVAAALKGSPAPLAALHHRADALIAGGPSAFHALLARLRGYPVVINKWASWCVPCQSEFPAFQKAAVAYGRRVAFVGVNGRDKNPSASGFLKQFPVTYPSYTDPGESIASTIHASTFYPMTVFVTRSGGFAYEHAGPYESAAALEHDIRFYLYGKR